MKEKKPVYKKWWFWVIAILFLIAISNSVSGDKYKTPEVSTEAASEASSEASDETASMPQTTEEKLTSILDSIDVHYSDLKIVSSPTEPTHYGITYHYDEEEWDETSFITSCLSDYINLCLRAYEIDDVQELKLYVFTDLKDTKGHIDSEKGFSIYMPRENFETFDWSNLKNTIIDFNTIESECEFLTIHPGIKGNVNFDKIMYIGK